MSEQAIIELINRGPVHLIGIKGTGMSALAELLVGRGIPVSGSDTTEEFYTDRILKEMDIPFREGFSGDGIPGETSLVVHSAAYTPENNAECAAAAARGIPLISYPRALGLFSRGSRFAGIAGIHGKTTTAAMAGTMLRETELPASVLVGSAVPAFGGRSTSSRGRDYFIAETCEYRRHFLNFRPAWIVVTNIEEDHLDYYTGAADVMDAFTEYAMLLEENGELIYCADDPGAVELAGRAGKARPDIRLIPYGFEARGPYRIVSAGTSSGITSFSLLKAGDFEIRVPGRHMVLDAAGALALCSRLMEDSPWTAGGRYLDAFRKGLGNYTGCRRRSEIVGEAAGVLFIDDYGHHPTEIISTLAGYREFYPGRRIIVDFMSHTYSRTEKLLEGFAGAFRSADMVILHRIYASAREKMGEVDGRRLYAEVGRHHGKVVYFDEVMDAEDYCIETLKEGDVFITMGAGNNWVLGRALFERFSRKGRAV